MWEDIDKHTLSFVRSQVPGPLAGVYQYVAVDPHPDLFFTLFGLVLQEADSMDCNASAPSPSGSQVGSGRTEEIDKLFALFPLLVLAVAVFVPAPALRLQ